MPSPFLARVRELAANPRPAITDDASTRSFPELHERALRARAALCAGADSLAGRRVALLVTPGTAWVEGFLGVLLGGGVAVPLSPLYPPSELAWFGDDAGADTLILSDDLAPRAELLAAGRRVLRVADLDVPHASAPAAIADAEGSDTALLLYTSGTTGKPKGAMITHDNLAAQGALLRAAWGFGDHDALLHALPLHHLHGLGISLLTALLSGARATLLPRFDARRVWEELASGKHSVWMAVPTMYQKLFEAFDAADAETRARWTEGARSLRLATSGSAALPVTFAERWRAITGAIPLERFGMTEIGVGMSNPLDPDRRRPGSVGPALPTVASRIVDEAGHALPAGAARGELHIQGPSVFKGYWNRPDATTAAFVDGWFRTGDIAERGEDGYVRLLGRTSVDILKSGGYKLSALEIEEALRESPAIAEIAVVGLPDEAWGDKVVAVLVPAPGREADCAPEALRAWARDRLPPYKIPRVFLTARALPRNPLGKVVKPELVKAILAGEHGALPPDRATGAGGLTVPGS